MGADRVVVLGGSQVAATAVRDLRAAGRPVLWLCPPTFLLRSPQDPQGDRELEVRPFPEEAEPDRGSLGEGAVSSVVVACADDPSTMVRALQFRGLAPGTPVVAAVQREELRRTLRAAGVTFVVSPHELAGRLCASAAFRPEAAEALEDLAASTYGAVTRQWRLPSGDAFVGRSFLSVLEEVRASSGCLLLGLARWDPRAGRRVPTVAPPPGERLRAEDVLIVLADRTGAERWDAWAARREVSV